MRLRVAMKVQETLKRSWEFERVDAVTLMLSLLHSDMKHSDMKNSVTSAMCVASWGTQLGIVQRDMKHAFLKDLSSGAPTFTNVPLLYLPLSCSY
jgi:hypothetical protein